MRENAGFPVNVDVYRGRAEQARLAAKYSPIPEHQKIFERLAAQYDAMAREAGTQTAEGAALLDALIADEVTPSN